MPPIPPAPRRSFDNEGLILRAEGRGDEARNAFEAALLLAPGDASAAWNLSELLRDQPAERDRSDRLLLQALGGGLPDPADALGNRVLRYAAGGERERAQRLVEQGLERLPREPRLWLLAGRLRLEREQCAPALQRLRARDGRSAPSAPRRTPRSAWRASASATPRAPPRHCGARWRSIPTSRSCASQLGRARRLMRPL